MAFPVALEGSVKAAEGNGREISFETDVTDPIGCTGAKLTGDLTAAKKASLAVDLEGCHESGEEEERCTSSGASTGVIALSGSGSLVYINKATKLAGILLSVGKVKVECPAGNWKIAGSLLSPITPINTETTKYTVLWHAKKAGEEEFMSYEGEKGEELYTKFMLDTGSAELETALEIAPAFGFTTSKTMKVGA